MNAFRRSAVRSLIWSHAFRTIPRLGIPALLFLCLGSFFLFSSGAALRELLVERQTPYELSIPARENVDYATIRQLPDVEALSPVLRLEGKLDHQEYSLNCSILAVSNAYPELEFVQGTMYPEESNMPFLVLNEAAAKGFRTEDGTGEAEIAVNTELLLTVGGETRKAVVCGIFRDGQEAPAAYIGYAAASRHWPATGEGEVLLRLANKGSVEKVIRDLKRLRLDVPYDQDVTRSWALLRQQLLRECLTGGLLWLCAGTLLARQKREEQQQRRREREALLLSGMTPGETERIYPLRVALAEFFCVGIAASAAIIAGCFTLPALFLCLGADGVLCLTMGNSGETI